MAWISIEKRYVYSTYVLDSNFKSVDIVKAEFIWDTKFNEGLIVIEFKDSLIEPRNYRPFNFLNCAKTFLKIVNEIKKTPSAERLEEFLKTL